MLLGIWNYLRGYVIIEVTGFSAERFINMGVKRGVHIWDAVRGPSAVSMKVSAGGFRLLCGFTGKTDCKVKILERKGLPFLLRRYRKRKFLIAGIFLFAALLYAMSSFIWLVELDGNERLQPDSVLSFLGQNGIRAGTLKYTVDEREAERALLAAFPDISWVSLRIRGTKLTVTLTETIPEREIADNTVPCDIVAKKAGLVVHIATSAGTPLVRQGDVVNAGDLLVSSELVTGTDDTGFSAEYTRARSEIRAKVYYEYSFTVPLKYYGRRYTGKVRRERTVILFGNNINLLKTYIQRYRSYDKIITERQLRFGGDYPLPVALRTAEYREFVPVLVERTVAEAEDIAEETVNSLILREFGAEADVVGRQVTTYVNGDSLCADAFITAVERIDEVREIKDTDDRRIREDNHKGGQ